MNQEAKELKAFLDAIASNPLDTHTRLVYADWLDEHDEPELAEVQRAFDVDRHKAEQWLRKFCDENRADYDDLLKEVAAGGHYCFGSDDGPYEARSDPDFWRNVQIVLNRHLDGSHIEGTTFSCSC